MKKIIAIVCVLAMCFGALTACMEKAPEVDTSAPVGVALVYGDTKTDVTVGQWEEKRTTVKAEDVSLGNGKEYEFSGVTIADLMAIAGVTECSSVVVRSSDGWEAIVDPADAQSYKILITDSYADGKEIPADAGGPIKMIFPVTDHPELNDKYDMYAWQWYVNEIEFVK